jgi:glycosyltransferase involved in cell wall biosynthesis
MKIYIVIPAHNEGKRIGKVIADIGATKLNLSIIVVDDGSTDNTSQIVSKFQISNFKFQITLLTHQINLGKGAAMKTGCEYAFLHGADAVIFMDSDGQHEVRDLPKFIEALNTGKYDVVLGTRNYSFGVPLVRYLGNKFASVVMAALFHTYVSDVICGYRAMTKKGYEKIKWDSDGYGVETEMVARMGKNRASFCEVPVATIYHDNVKGVTLLDAIGILGDVLKWRLTL